MTGADQGGALTEAEREALLRAWPWPSDPGIVGDGRGFGRVAAAVERIVVARLADEREARITAGRANHGVGASEDFPGNVSHLVSPVVGIMRLRQRDGEADRLDLDWIIDRLSLVLDMALAEAEGGEQR